jgi:BMFP domain-containing protein YqiC
MRQRVAQGLFRLIDKGTHNKTHNTHMTKVASIEKKVRQNLQRKLDKLDKGTIH